jgi:hypothetical protein
MSYEQFAVTVTTDQRNYRWDFSGTDLRRRVYSHTFPEPFDLTFHAKAFEPLRESDLEEWQTVTTYAMTVTRCGLIRGSERCLDLANVYDFQWTPKDDDNLTMGILWSSDGEPNSVAFDEWEDWETEFDFECDPGNSSLLPSFIWDPTLSEPKLILKWTNHISCPTGTSTKATPTPGPWSPSCQAQFRSNDEPWFGIFADLKELNNGRFGHGQTVTLNGEPRFLLYSACDRMVACPWGAVCDTPDLTSVWMCSFGSSGDDATLTNCSAYGVVPENPKFTLSLAQSLVDGFYYDLDTQNGKSTRVYYRCSELYPYGHIRYLAWATSATPDWKNLTLTVETQEACARNVPTPLPLKGQCEVDLIQGNYELDLDLSKYSETATNQTVTRTDQNRTYQLLYRPCDGIPCPRGYDCGGDEDATVWLCEQFTTAHEPFCTGYGLHKYNLSITVRGGYIFAGIDVRYQGDNHRDAHVGFACNSALPLDVLSISNWVSVDDNHLYFETGSRRACPVGTGPTPSPYARLIPTKPSIVKTPTPIASPNPHHVLLNDTHLVIVDLQAIQEPYPLRVTQDISFGRYMNTIYTEWNSWTTLACPSGWGCSSRRANLWS